MGLISKIKSVFSGTINDYVNNNNKVYGTKITFHNHNSKVGGNINSTSIISNKIGREMSKIDVKLDAEGIFKDDFIKKFNYTLRLRPNDLQSSNNFWQTFFYNVEEYSHGFALCDFDMNGVLIGMEIIHPNLYSHAVIIDGDMKFHCFISDDKTRVIDYRNIIHIRKYAQSIQYSNDFNISNREIPSIIESSFTNLLQELEDNNEVDIIIRLGSDTNANSNPFNITKLDPEAKEKRLDEILEGIRKRAIVLDSTESIDFRDKKSSLSDTIIQDMKTLDDWFYEKEGINPKIMSGTWTYEEFSAFYNSKLEHYIIALEQELNYKLITKEEFLKGAEINIILDRLSGATFKDMVTFFDKGIYGGWLNRNDVRNYLGRPPVEGGDEFYGNLNQRELQGKEVIDDDGNDL